MDQQTNPQQSNHTNTSIPYQYLVEQGLAIHRLTETLQSNIVAYGLNVFISIVFQIVCYLIFAFTIYLAITMPTEISMIFDMMGKEMPSIVLSIDWEPLTYFLMSVKIILVVVSLPVLICAFLLGKNRRRAARMRKAFEEVELLKRSHNEMLSRLGN